MKHEATGLGGVSRETEERLRAYAELLLKWNRTINLIGKNTQADLWGRHILDSLQLVPFLPDAMDHGIDIGSGGGLPGMVLAIATGRPFHLIEVDQRKAAFLREAGRMTGASVTVHAVRAERALVPPAKLVTARAVAPLRQLLAWAVPHLAEGGICLFPKGRNSADELRDARIEWEMQVDVLPSKVENDSCILRIGNINAMRPSEPT